MEHFISLTTVEALVLLFTVPWFLLALLAAFTDASVGFVDEWLLRTLGAAKGSAVDAPGRLVLFSGFFGVVISMIAVLLSLTLGDEYSLSVPIESFISAFGAGILEVCWLIPYFYALNRGGALNSTPLFQTIPIFSLMFGLLLFNEVPTAVHILATIMIIGGAFVLNYEPRTCRFDTAAIGLMLLSSAIISLSYFLFKDATESGNFVASLFGNGLGMAFLSATIWIAWKPYRDQFNDFIRTLNCRVFAVQFSNEGLASLGTIATQLAIVLGPSVMVVSALNAFQPIFTLLIAKTLSWLGSRQHTEQLTGSAIFKTFAIALIAAGTVLIVL
jgi:drug/metabolite transporter (DMT)-like permease